MNNETVLYYLNWIEWSLRNELYLEDDPRYWKYLGFCNWLDEKRLSSKSQDIFRLKSVLQDSLTELYPERYPINVMFGFWFARRVIPERLKIVQHAINKLK